MEIMYDSPTEFLHGVADEQERCMAQSVIPDDEGGYRCACSCERWEITAPTREEGLRLAREHTAETEAGRAAAKSAERHAASA